MEHRAQIVTMLTFLEIIWGSDQYQYSPTTNACTVHSPIHNVRKLLPQGKFPDGSDDAEYLFPTLGSKPSQTNLACLRQAPRVLSWYNHLHRRRTRLSASNFQYIFRIILLVAKWCYAWIWNAVYSTYRLTQPDIANLLDESNAYINLGLSPLGSVM